MFNAIKNKISNFVVKRKFLKKERTEINFNGFYSKSVRFLIILPSDEIDFKNADLVIKYLLNHQKSVSLFCIAHRVNTIPEKEKYHVISYDIKDVTKLELPHPNYLEKLNLQDYDIVVDLNLKNNIFCSAFTNFVDSKFRIGFIKENSDKYYNFQIQNDENNPELSYRNLLNSLEMF